MTNSDNNSRDIIAFWGYPAPALINKYKNKNTNWIDLDIDFGYPDAKILPDAYCQIIKNIINNAVYLKSRIKKNYCTDWKRQMRFRLVCFSSSQRYGI